MPAASAASRRAGRRTHVTSLGRLTMKLIRAFALSLHIHTAPKLALVVCALVVGLINVVAARDGALPTTRINYQGVLRDQNDLPLSGTYDMTFRFMDAATAGNTI